MVNAQGDLEADDRNAGVPAPQTRNTHRSEGFNRFIPASLTLFQRTK